MRRPYQIALASFMLAAFTFLSTSVASAADHWDLDIAPVYFADTTGDSQSPPPAGSIPFYCSGLQTCSGTPKTTMNFRLNYGLTYSFNRKWSLAYTHDNFDFSLGRILTLAPGTSLISGSVNDRTDKIALNYAYGHGLTLTAYYASHQRSNIEATFPQFLLPPGAPAQCFFNSEQCPGNTSNPSSINSNLWALQGSYVFGPHLRYEPPMFKVSAEMDYYPRPNNANCLGTNPEPACNSNGIPGYRGSGVTFPYSLTFFPFSDTKFLPPGTIPFLGYENVQAWFHAENSPEAYNATIVGLVQILPHGLTFSYTYFKLQGRKSSDTIPPPDVVRSVVSIVKLSYGIKF